MTAPGGPEVLCLVELPEPEITGQRDVIVGKTVLIMGD
jgi:hypothetical protein